MIEPTSWAQALASPERDFWIEAGKAELRSLRSNHCYAIASARQCRAEGRRAIGCKWVFKVKRRADGSVERYKVRLVAQGFSQTPGEDFFATFAPVLMYKSLRMLLQLAARFDWEIDQMDVVTAFLNGDLKETLYMRPPAGYADLVDAEAAAVERGGVDEDDVVWRLRKAIYGTRQASNVWHESINTTLVSLGFRPCRSDPCVYVRVSQTGCPMVIGLFVDDMVPIYSRSDRSEWVALKSKLMSAYSMKDLGSAQWVLGMKIVRDRERRLLWLTQELYVDKMLQEFRLVSSDSAPTPEESTIRLTKADGAQTREQQDEMSARPYMELVGSLLYATTSVFFEAAHAVGILTRYMQAPGPRHWQAAKRVLRYLKGCKAEGITYGQRQRIEQEERQQEQQQRSSKQVSSQIMHAPAAAAARGPHACVLTVYCDADWAGSVDDRRSTTGCVILLDGAPVIWLSKKQATVALSTAEAEYMAMSAAVTELKWARQLLTEIGSKPDEPIDVYSDNQAAVSIATSPSVSHTRTKHIDLRHHFVRECIDAGLIRLRWIRSNEQLADVFTKGLNRQQHAELTHKIKTGGGGVSGRT